MVKVRLRTKFLLSLLSVSVGLTCATLVVVQRSLDKEIRDEIFADLRNSVLTFQSVQRQHELGLSRSAGLLADLPPLRALMTTRDAATIQDASTEFWKLAGSNLFILADTAGQVVALHTATPGFSRALAQQCLARSLPIGDPRHWWYGAGHLYEVFLQPMYFGSPSDNHLLGVLAVGYEIDSQVARDVSRIAASQVAFRYGNAVVVSTLSPLQEQELASRLAGLPQQTAPTDVQLGGERFLAASIALSPEANGPAVSLSVLKSYDAATMFLHRLNRLLLAMGLVAVIGGTALVFLISHTFTRPLKTLVAGVRSLEKGNFAYPLLQQGDDEITEVTGAFVRMRRSLRATQQQLLAAERLATIGTMASSISHDLRHALTAVVANAEFLCENGLNEEQREELYHEIRVAVDQMTEMIESLLEFSRTPESLRRSSVKLDELVRRAASAVRAHPQGQGVAISVSSTGPVAGAFDHKKLQRVFYNLLLNACEATRGDRRQVEVSIRELGPKVEIRVCDNGTGIPQAIRGRLFQPFVSSGKENGTGMGLAVVQKILQDHGGDIVLESTSAQGSVFKITLPLVLTAEFDEPSTSPFVREHAG